MVQRIVQAPRTGEKAEIAKALRKNSTPAERSLWSLLRRNQLDGLHVRRQQIVHGFIVDFYCVSAKLVVECDGNVHLKRTEYDLERDTIIGRTGLLILRFSNEDVLENTDCVVAAIRNAVRSRTMPNTDLTQPKEG